MYSGCKKLFHLLYYGFHHFHSHLATGLELAERDRVEDAEMHLKRAVEIEGTNSLTLSGLVSFFKHSCHVIFLVCEADLSYRTFLLDHTWMIEHVQSLFYEQCEDYDEAGETAQVAETLSEVNPQDGPGNN